MAETTGRYGDNADTRAGDEDARRSGRRHVGVAEAKGTFSAMIEGVQHRGERYVIERHGKPAAALVSLEELDRLEERAAPPARQNDGLTGLIGLFRGVLTDEEIDEMIAEIYADRERDVPREIDTSEWGV